MRLFLPPIILLFLLFAFASLPSFGQDETPAGDPDYADEPASRVAEDATGAALAIGEAFEKRNALIAETERRIRKMSPAGQLAAVRRLPPGIFVDVPAFWRTVREPNLVMQSLYYYGEPVSKGQLDALERLFGGVGPGDELQAAMVLYRYGRPSGREYLMARLAKSREGLVAEAFALNREKDALPLVTRVLNSPAVDPNLYTALQDWPEQVLQKPVLGRLRRAVARGHAKPDDRSNNYLIESMIRLAACYSLEGAVDDIRKAYRLPDPGVRAAAAVALLRLEPVKDPEISSAVSRMLDDSLNDEAGGDAWRTGAVVLSNMIAVKNPEALPYLRKLADRYTAGRPRTSDQGGGRSGPRAQHDAGAVAAAAAATGFARYESVEDAVSAERILRRMNEDNVDVYFLREAASALFLLKPTSPALKSVMGGRWVKSQQALTASAKKLPRQFRLDTLTIDLY